DRQGREDQRREGAVHAAEDQRHAREARRDRQEPDRQPGGGAEQRRQQRRGHCDQHERHSSTSAMIKVMLSGPPRSLARAISASTEDWRRLVRRTSASTSSGVTRPWSPSAEITNTSPRSTATSMTSGAT